MKRLLLILIVLLVSACVPKHKTVRDTLHLDLVEATDTQMKSSSSSVSTSVASRLVNTSMRDRSKVRTIEIEYSEPDSLGRQYKVRERSIAADLDLSMSQDDTTSVNKSDSSAIDVLTNTHQDKSLELDAENQVKSKQGLPIAIRMVVAAVLWIASVLITIQAIKWLRKYR